MAAFPQFYDVTDTTLQTGSLPVSQDAGTTYGPTTLHLWNDKGALLGATVLRNCRIVPKVFNGVSRVTSGFPVLDESWVKIQLSGMNNTADSTMPAQSTGFVPIGANNPLVFKDISVNCARFLDIKIDVPAGAGPLTQDLYLEIVYDEATLALPLKTGQLIGPGVLQDFLDLSAQRLVFGGGLTAVGTAVVTVAIGGTTFNGTPLNFNQQAITIDQNDGNAQALTAGQSYIAVLTKTPSGSPIVRTTKGARATSPVAPAVPSGEVFLGKVTIAYQAGGVSIITTGNLDMSGVLYGEFFAWIKSGLILNIGGGTAIAQTDVQPFSGSVQSVALTDNATNTVFLRGDGSFYVLVGTWTGLPPFPDAMPLAQAITAGAAITSLTDIRPLIGRALTEIQFELALYGPPVVGQQSSARIIPDDVYLEFVDFHIGRLGVGATSGNFQIDVVAWPRGNDVSGASASVFFTSPVDQRPIIPYNAAAGALFSELNRTSSVLLQKGSRVALQIIAIPAGTFTTDPQDVTVILRCRKARNGQG